MSIPAGNQATVDTIDCIIWSVLRQVTWYPLPVYYCDIRLLLSQWHTQYVKGPTIVTFNWVYLFWGHQKRDKVLNNKTAVQYWISDLTYIWPVYHVFVFVYFNISYLARKYVFHTSRPVESQNVIARTLLKNNTQIQPHCEGIPKLKLTGRCTYQDRTAVLVIQRILNTHTLCTKEWTDK